MFQQPRILPDSGSVKGQAVCAFAFHESWRGDRQSTEESVHLVVDQKVLYIGWPLGKTTRKMIFQPLNWKCYPWSFECGSNLTSQGTGFSLRWYLPRCLFCLFFAPQPFGGRTDDCSTPTSAFPSPTAHLSAKARKVTSPRPRMPPAAENRGFWR